MNTDLIDHLKTMMPKAGDGWGKVYRVTKDHNFVHVTEIDDEITPIIVYDGRYLPNVHYTMKLKEFGSVFLWNVLIHCEAIGFRPLFRSKGQFNEERNSMDYVTTVHVPTEMDGVLLQAYLDTL